jgi:hypothetical protein
MRVPAASTGDSPLTTPLTALSTPFLVRCGSAGDVRSSRVPVTSLFVFRMADVTFSGQHERQVGDRHPMILPRIFPADLCLLGMKSDQPDQELRNALISEGYCAVELSREFDHESIRSDRSEGKS